MKLVSIITVWADCLCLLPACIKNHLEFCDEILVLWSQHSRHGEKSDAVLEFIASKKHDARVTFHQLEPMRGMTPLYNETRIRNYGIDLARTKKFTHFLIADADEFYIPNQMQLHKDAFQIDPKINGFVHPLKVYIKTPTLWTHDHTLVPGIHRLLNRTECGSFRFYPFAYDDKGQAHIDPSRRLNFYDGIEKAECFMHHMSYVRSDIDLKIDNSTANLRRSRQVIYNELREANPGYVSKLYHQPLQQSENIFNIEL